MSETKGSPEQQNSSEETKTGFSVFILKSKPETLKSAEAFLRNRNWKIGTGTNFREALAYIIQKQPEFVLIAADHPNKKIKILPKLLTQAFPVKLISYAESQASASIAALHEFGLEYSLFPPVSGPAIERIILKMKRDEEKFAQEIKNRIASGELDESSEETIRLKGLKSADSSTKESFENARAALNQLISGDEHSEGSTTDHSENLTQDNQNAYIKADADKSKAHSFLQEGQSNWNPLDHQDRGRESSEINFSQGTNSSTNENQNSNSGTRQDRVPVMEFENAKKKKKLTVEYKNKDSAKVRDNDSIIVKGAQAALDEVAIAGDGIEKLQNLEKTSNCACLIIESDRFSGYLVAALGKDRKIDQSFMTQIKKRLFSFLKNHGENIQDENSMDIKLEAVEFEDWALEQADFLRKSVHEGDEIAMAFFPSKETSVRLEQSASEKMLMVNINELKDDTIVEFDLYIYMPENNKYILYTPQGRTLFGKQRGRLVDKGIKHMHLKKESAHNVKKYRAQNYLNEKIQNFKNAQKTKTS